MPLPILTKIEDIGCIAILYGYFTETILTWISSFMHIDMIEENDRKNLNKYGGVDEDTERYTTRRFVNLYRSLTSSDSG